MKYRMPGFVLLAAICVVAVSSFDASAGPFDTWSYKSKVTFYGHAKPALTNFPALVILGTNVSAMQYQDFQVNGTDLRFANSNETVELRYELENWNSNGQSFAWVHLPKLSGTNTYIWMYWGKATNKAPAYTTNGLVWTNAVGVWHMNAANAADSSANRFSGTANGTVTQVSDGRVDGANDFVADSSYVQVPDQAAFTLGSLYTVSAWVRSDSLADYEGFAGTYNGSGFIFALFNDANNQLAFWASDWRYSGAYIPDGQWTHVAYTVNGSQGYFYVNGVRVASIPNALAIGNGGNLELGGGGASWNSYRFDGKVDEVRISNVDRSSNWVWACAMNQGQHGSFVSYGAASYPTLTVVSSAESQKRVRSARLNGVVGGTGGGANPKIWFCYDKQDKGTSATSSWTKVTYVGNSWGIGQSFGLVVTNLAMNTTCVYRVYATNSTGTDWSYPVSFRVLTEWCVATNGSDAPATKGTNWTSALKTISNGVARAQANDVVMVSNGTYQITAQLLLNKAVVVRGFNGANATIIDCDVPGSTTSPVLINHASAILERFKIIDCTELTYNYFGPIYLTDGIVRNCILTTNICVSSGGGYVGGNGFMYDCIITNNKAVHQNTGMGGGIRVSGNGVVSNCFIANNQACDLGGGVWMDGGKVTACVISNNYVWAPYTTDGGGGAYISGGRMENCLILKNKNTATAGVRGGGVYLAGGQLVNCTVVENTLQVLEDGSGLYQTGGGVTNCILYYNGRIFPATNGQNVVKTGGNLVRSCMQPLVAGTGNITNNPDFANRQVYDYRIGMASPCVDAGTNVAVVTGSMGGTARPSDGNSDGVARHDMGCYEYAFGGSFACGFSTPTRTPYQITPVVFTAVVGGTGTNNVTYCWDWTNDGTIDLSGTDRRIVTNTFGSFGWTTVRLVCTNAFATTATCVRTNYLKVWPASVYVSPIGGNVSPYETWAKAANTIQAAVPEVGEGGTVYVTNGTYVLTSQLLIERPITVRGFNGAAVTILDCDVGAWPGYTPPIRINKPGAVFERFKVTDCNELYYGYYGPIYLENGTVRYCTLTGNNCVSSGGGYVGGGFLHSCTITNNIANHYNTGVGAGLRVAGGVVSNCFVAKNQSADGGGGFYITGGTVKQCIISNNTAVRNDGGGAKGGGVWIAGGRIENCLVITNRITATLNTDGGGIYQAGGDVVNCTVADNKRAQGPAGSGLTITAGAVTNSIFYYNSDTYPAISEENVKKSGGTIAYSCMQPLVAGTGNTESNPDFLDRPARIYRLSFGSPCVDTGSNVPSIKVDLAWTNRPLDGDGSGTARHDMGCYERPATNAGFVCSFAGVPTIGSNSLTVVFTASVGGPGTNNVTYWWDWTNDGTIDLGGSTRRIVTNNYAQPGLYSVRLVCTNAVGTPASKTMTGYIKVWPSVTYASPTGGNTAPYDTWAKAATSLAAAFNEVGAGGTVWVSNGTYSISSTINIEKAVTIRSIAGANATILVSTGPQVFVINHPSVLIDGFRMRGVSLSYYYYGVIQMNSGGIVRNCVIYNNNLGSCGGIGVLHANALVENCVITNNSANHQNSGYGGGFRITGGLVRNCTIYRNWANDGGGGVYLTGGVLSNCTIRGNWRTGGNGSRYGGGVWNDGGTVLNCEVLSNSVIGATSAGGGGVYQVSGLMRNMLISRNVSTNQGGGVYLTGGIMENCTVVSNLARANIAGGLYQAGGAMTNSIVYYNRSTGPGLDDFGGPVTNLGYCCGPGLPATKGNISGAPQFVNTNMCNYRLTGGSPGVNTGTNKTWMVTGVDLDGASRIRKGRVDMGCYETPSTIGALFLFR